MEFPITPPELAKVFEIIGIDGKESAETRITEYNIPGMPHLQEALGEFEKLDELNYLGDTLLTLEPSTEAKVDSIVLLGKPVSALDVVSISQVDNLACFDFLPDIHSYESLGELRAEQERDVFSDQLDAIKAKNPALGKYLQKLEDCAEMYIGERYANEAMTGEVGTFSSHGYITQDLDQDLNFLDCVPETLQVTDQALSLVRPEMTREKADYIVNKVEELTEEGYSFIDGRRNSGPKEKEGEAPSLKDRLQAGRDAAAEHKSPEQSAKAGRDNSNTL